jgi:hypothetical protein
VPPSVARVLLLAGEGMPGRWSQPISWPFAKGFSCCLSVYYEQFGDRQSSLFRLESGTHGGYEAYILQGKVYFRGIDSKGPGNSVLLGTVAPRKWTFLGFNFEEARALSKAKVTFYKNGEVGLTYNCESAKPQSAALQVRLFTDFIGMASDVLLFTKALGPRLQEFIYETKSLQSFKEQVFQLEVRRGGLLVDRGRACEFRGPCSHLWDKPDLEIVLVLLHYLRFVKKSFFQKHVLDMALNLVKLAFQDKDTQAEAASSNFFGMLSHQLMNLPS